MEKGWTDRQKDGIRLACPKEVFLCIALSCLEFRAKPKIHLC